MAIKGNAMVKYYRMMVNHYIPFVLYVSLFLIISIYMLVAIKIDVVEEYECDEIKYQNDEAYVIVKAEIKDTFEYVYLYTDKNKGMLKVEKLDSWYKDKFSHIRVFVTEPLRNLLNVSDKQNIYVEIPQSKTSLLKRLFYFGGN